MSFRGNPNVVNKTDAQDVAGVKTFNNDTVFYQDGDYSPNVVIRNKWGQTRIVETTSGLTLYEGTSTAFAALTVKASSSASTAICNKGRNYTATTSYQKLGTGTGYNWGTVAHSTAAVTITFGTPFANTNYSVTAVLQTDAASTVERYCPIVYSKSKTGCTIWIKGTDGNISWQAIGQVSV